MIFIEYIQKSIQKSVMQSSFLQIKQFIHSWVHFYRSNALSSYLLNKSDLGPILMPFSHVFSVLTKQYQNYLTDRHDHFTRIDNLLCTTSFHEYILLCLGIGLCLHGKRLAKERMTYLSTTHLFLYFQ